MSKIKILTIFLISVIFTGCSGTNFMGAQKHIGGFFFIERWYLNKEFNKNDIPSGTQFYGASAQKIKNKFTIKYYIADDEGSTIPIPIKDMWKVKHNGKRFNYQDDDNLFYYIKKENNKFAKRINSYRNSSHAIRFYDDNEPVILPIKKCYENGWCKLYPNYYNEDIYVRKEILYK